MIIAFNFSADNACLMLVYFLHPSREPGTFQILSQSEQSWPYLHLLNMQLFSLALEFMAGDLCLVIGSYSPWSGGASLWCNFSCQDRRGPSTLVLKGEVNLWMGTKLSTALPPPGQRLKCVTPYTVCKTFPCLVSAGIRGPSHPHLPPWIWSTAHCILWLFLH